MLVDPDTSLQVRGADSLPDAELLSFLFARGGKPGRASVDIAAQVLVRAGGLAGLPRLGSAELCEVSGVGPVRARRLQAFVALARRMVERPIPRGSACRDPRAVWESVRGRLGRCPQERFVVLLLDSRLHKLAEIEVCRGGSNSVSVLPRDVFEPALREGAQAVILVHNHPSGDPTPSPEDLAMTERLVAAGELLGIAVRDHVVVGEGRYCSLAELGHLDPVPSGFRAGGGRELPVRAAGPTHPSGRASSGCPAGPRGSAPSPAGRTPP